MGNERVKEIVRRSAELFQLLEASSLEDIEAADAQLNMMYGEEEEPVEQ